MSESPDVRWTNRRDHPPTPQQRRLGIRVALGIMLTALLVIILLDHYGILH